MGTRRGLRSNHEGSGALAMDDLYAYLRDEALKLEGEFRQASIAGRGTPQEVADITEQAVREFIGRFFPSPHKITKGKIRDSFGGISASVDCVVCNPNHPYTVDNSGKFRLLFAEGVDAAIEVKPDIGDAAELSTGLEQGLSVKALKRHNTPTLMRTPWIEEVARRVPFVIFAMRCKSDPIKTGREVLRFYSERKTPPTQQADFVAVNGVGIFMNFVDPSMNCWIKAPQPPEAGGWYFEQWEDDTLAGLVWRLQQVAHASIKQIEDVLPRYLQPKSIRGLRKIEDT